MNQKPQSNCNLTFDQMFATKTHGCHHVLVLHLHRTASLQIIVVIVMFYTSGQLVGDVTENRPW